MVNQLMTHYVLLAQATNETVLEKLEPDRRAAVILALVGLGLLGVLLVVVTMLAGRWARHDRASRGTRLGAPTEEVTTREPKMPTGDIRRGETMVSEQGDQDTKA
jgi:hypothetical protein